ncbi:MAG: hypothetical protein IT233_05065 [Bacteroidia bacterium]|nr:hypothetical protein [Bacteroidia bacterium]
MFRNLTFPALLLLLAASSSCRKDQLLTDAAAKLEMSTDSILYDTVFTSIGSTTRSFLVYNRHEQPMNISRIWLESGQASDFRFNIDGFPGPVVNDVEIPAKDSLWVFVEVTVDPNSQNSPLIITDKLLFETNGNIQQVVLEAWGQDAHYFNGQVLCNQTWNNDKPYLIYNSILVDSLCSLTINAGCRIHFHKGSALLVQGTLIVNGTRSNPAVFQGDRLEPFYAEVADQWFGIWLLNGSRDNIVDGAVIKNAYIGIRSDTMNYSVNPTLLLKNSILKNHAAAALYGVGSKVRAYNCTFGNCGQYAAALAIGGDYSFYHCTFANYWNLDNRQTPALIINNYYESSDQNIITRPLDSCNFYNCIIYGDLANEIELDQSTNTSVNYRYKFHYCVLKTELPVTGPYFISPVVNQDPAFLDSLNGDYKLRPLSSAINKGDMNVISTFFPGELNLDLKGNSRITDGPPDCGAYEYNQ